MITVITNREKYFYDIHSLVKSFYPEEDVLVFVKGTREEPPVGSFVVTKTAGKRDKNRQPDEGKEVILSISLNMDFEGGLIRVEITHLDGTKVSESMHCEGEPDTGSADLKDSPKNVMKRLVYRMLSKEIDTSLPWGTLTGIRPVKIAMHLLEEGTSDPDIADYMKDTYLCTQEKTDLSLEIAHKEARLLKGVGDGKGYSLYINIPFCPTRCAYCSFMSSPIGLWKNKVDEYLECVHKEIAATAPLFKEKRLDAIYVGGGTPTTLEADQLDRMITWVEEAFDLSYLREFTIESGRPDSITMDKLLTMKRHGVTRISVNPQTMRDKTLQLIGRHHSVQQTIDSFYMAREAGFDHINMDIILGLPGEEISDVQYTMDEISKIRPDELTVHSLAIKRASRLYDYVGENGLAGMQTTEAMVEIAAKGARAMGLTPYYLYRQKNISGNFENTGFGIGDKMSLYNIITMEEVEDIAALGAGAVSKRVYGTGRIERCDTMKNIALYMDNIEEMMERRRKLFTAD